MQSFFLLPHKIVDYRGEQVEKSPVVFLLLVNSPASGSSTQAELSPQPGFNPLQSSLLPQFD
jgi:hypothetical protein